jgi:hypothetical protein
LLQVEGRKLQVGKKQNQCLKSEIGLFLEK